MHKKMSTAHAEVDSMNSSNRTSSFMITFSSDDFELSKNIHLGSLFQGDW